MEQSVKISLVVLPVSVEMVTMEMAMFFVLVSLILLMFSF